MSGVEYDGWELDGATVWQCEGCGADVLDALQGCDACINDAHDKATADGAR